MVRGGGQPRNVISKLAQREVCVKEKTLLRGVPTGVQVTPVSSCCYRGVARHETSIHRGKGYTMS